MLLARILISLICTTLVIPALSKETPVRPKILGISFVTTSVSSICKTREFYSELVGQASLRCREGENVTGGAVLINSGQMISLSADDPAGGTNRILRVVFLTEDVRKMREYLRSRNIKTQDEGNPSGLFVSILDPEGHRISFIQNSVKQASPSNGRPLPL